MLIQHMLALVKNFNLADFQTVDEKANSEIHFNFTKFGKKNQEGSKFIRLPSVGKKPIFHCSRSVLP